MEIKEFILKYGIFLRRRFYLKEKMRLLYTLKQDFEELGYPITFHQDKIKLSKATNMMVNDPKKADLIFLAHYDTPAQSFVYRQTYNPFDIHRQVAVKFINESLPIVLVLTLGTGFLIYLMNSPLDALYKYALIALLLFVIMSLFRRYAKGAGSNYNLNQNTAALAIAYDLAKKLDPENQQVAFVFSDSECLNHHGDLMLKAYLGNSLSTKTIVHLSGLAFGPKLIVRSTSKNKSLQKSFASNFSELSVKEGVVKKEQIEDHSLKSYPKSIAIMGGNTINGVPVLLKSSKKNDGSLDLEFMKQVSEGLEKLVKTYNL